jgi:tetratricopeptide (TPR) repeat protein
MPLRWVILAALVLAPPSSRADPQKARASFDRGTALYAVEHWDEAIREFEAGFIEEPLPSFLYNIAQAHKHAGRPAKAVAYYQKYLDLLPNAPDRAQVEQEIAELGAAPPVAPAPAAAAVVPPAPAPADGPPPPIYKRWWLWAAVGAVVVIAGAAVAIGVATSRPAYPSTDLGFYPFP